MAKKTEKHLNYKKIQNAVKSAPALPKKFEKSYKDPKTCKEMDSEIEGAGSGGQSVPPRTNSTEKHKELETGYFV